MRPIGASVLLILFMLAMLRPVAPLLDYAINKGYFAEVLCVNKDKPELECNGKCVLMQRLKQAMGEPLESTPAKPIEGVNLKDYPIGFIASLELPTNTSLRLELQTDNRRPIAPLQPILEIIQPPS